MPVSYTQYGRGLLTLLILLGLGWGAAPRGYAGAYNYGTRTRTINAGVLVVDDPNSGNFDAGTLGSTADDPDPYVFYILNQREDVKPFGWNIVNPLAPHTVTGNILDRWDMRTSNNVYYTINQAITPNMAPYWEVPLSTTPLTSLEEFDVLILNIQNHTINLTDTEINELRRYVDNGGQLWIEDSGQGAVNPTYTQYSLYSGLFLDANFDNNVSATSSFGLPNSGGLLLHHPIIDSPYLLLPSDLDGLGNAAGHTQDVVSNKATNALPDTSILGTVVTTSGAPSGNGGYQPVIAAGQYGAGQVIIESTGAADAINSAVLGLSDGVTGQLNAGPYCGTTFANAPAVDLKFMADLMSWSASHPNEHKNSHQSNASPNTLGPALSPTWTYALQTVAQSAFTPGVAINGSFAYVRTADGYLRCFNTTPGTDIIGTGYADAGTPDYSDGDPYDEVWDTQGHPFSTAIQPLAFDDPNGSAPTVATIPIGGGAQTETVVFVEDSAGDVYGADAITGAPVDFKGKNPGELPSGSTTGASTAAYGAGGVLGPAPAPTVYGGRLYAGQPDGTLYVYDFRVPEVINANVASVNKTIEYVTAPPTVGYVHELVTDSTGASSYVDDLVVTVTTNEGTYTLQGGARHDPLFGTGTYLPKPASNGGQPSIDESVPANEDQVYSDELGYQYYLGPLPSAGYVPTGASPAPPYFGDYDADFFNLTGSVTRAIFVGGMSGALPTISSISPSALDSNGDFYYIVNAPFAGGTAGVDSTLVCAHGVRDNDEKDTAGISHSRMIWRFRLPVAGENITDADGVNYSQLEGFVFVGTPVVDSQGDVYALAQNGSTVAALCFKATQGVTIQMPVNNSGGVVNINSLSQPVLGGIEDEFGDSPAQTVPTNGFQYSNRVNFQGLVSINSFGAPLSGANNGETYPNLSEPQPVDVTYVVNSANGSVQQTVPASLHTNLVWYAILPDQANALLAGSGAYLPPSFPKTIQLGLNSGPALVGDYLFFGDSAGNIYRLYAYPQGAGLVGTATRQVALIQVNTASSTGYGPTSDSEGRALVADSATRIGQINGVVSAGNGVLIANGTLGVAAFGTKYTLVSDATRVMEVDSEGIATWLVDATAETTASGKTTHVELNHPASVTQITSNDYLVADTGNNRCVRFDRSGNVVWELSKLNDTALVDATNTAIPFYSAANGKLAQKDAPLLAPGEPLTLNHPTSVTSYLQNVTDTSGNPDGTLVHYLIADTGNHRIVEVVDAFDKNGAPVGTPHDIVWVSRTYDAEGRDYDYTSANYFSAPGGSEYIAALVTNKRVAQLSPSQALNANTALGALGPVSDEPPGSSIVLLDYDPAIANPTTQKNGFIHVTSLGNSYHLSAISSFLGYFIKSTRQFDLAGSPKYIASTTLGGIPRIQAATAQPQPLYLRNPRFLQTYTPPGGVGAVQNFLLADDDGVFDLYLDPTGKYSGVANYSEYANNLEAMWGFTQADYANVVDIEGLYDPIPGVGFTRNGYNTLGTQVSLAVPFMPNSLVRTTTDTVLDPITNTDYLIGHYLVTNGYTQAEVTPISNFGGEVIELGADLSPIAVNGLAAGTLSNYLVSSFGKLSNNDTAPLSQPTDAAPEK